MTCDETRALSGSFGAGPGGDVIHTPDFGVQTGPKGQIRNARKWEVGSSSFIPSTGLARQTNKAPV